MAGLDRFEATLGDFLKDVGVTGDSSIVPANTLYRVTVGTFSNYASKQKAWNDEATLISEMVGVANDPIFSDGLTTLMQMTPDRFKRTIAGRPKAFLEFIKPGAKATEKKYGIPAALTIAQAMLESAHGKHSIGYNLFGIKAHRGWTGKTQTVKTHEEINGVKKLQDGTFKDFNNFYEAIEEHAKTLMSPRYAHARAQYAKDKNPFNFAKNITGIYATDSEYGQKIASVINTYNLTMV